MGYFWERARNGSWLTRQRAAVYSTMLLVGYGIAVLAMAATSPDGRTDIQGRPLGTDFSNVYAAGTYVLDEQAAAAFDPNRQEAREKEIFGEATPFYGWHYPPFFLGLAALFALLPYAAALVVWQVASFSAYLFAIRVSFGEAASRIRVDCAAGGARRRADRLLPDRHVVDGHVLRRDLRLERPFSALCGDFEFFSRSCLTGARRFAYKPRLAGTHTGRRDEDETATLIDIVIRMEGRRRRREAVWVGSDGALRGVLLGLCLSGFGCFMRCLERRKSGKALCWASV